MDEPERMAFIIRSTMTAVLTLPTANTLTKNEPNKISIGTVTMASAISKIPIVCSKQLYKEALGHDYDEPKQWELREINDIMNNAVTGWRAFSNPRYFPEPYRRQKGWERIRNDNEPDNSMDGFQEIPTEEMEQLGLPEEWLKQK